MRFQLPKNLQLIHDERLSHLMHSKQGELLKSMMTGDHSREMALRLKPWRKGPFTLPEFTIDSEWVSEKKWQRLAPHLGRIEGRDFLDIGCGNGFYMRKLASLGASVTGFDPGPLNYLQWKYIEHFTPHETQKLYLLGAEHTEQVSRSFDGILYMGVFYHHRDPLAQLMHIREALKNKGTLYLETIGIAGDDERLYVPGERYAGMPNVWMLPTLKSLIKILERLKFIEIEVLSTSWEGEAEQRATDWSAPHSFKDALDPQNRSLTIEGEPYPERFLIKASRIL